jgi:D-alanyl-D-alanine carboxypeptidase
LFAKNADERLPLASLTKLMSAEAVLAHATLKKNYYHPESSKPDGDWGFKVGEEWPLGDLITLASLPPQTTQWPQLQHHRSAAI